MSSANCKAACRERSRPFRQVWGNGIFFTPFLFEKRNGVPKRNRKGGSKNPPPLHPPKKLVGFCVYILRLIPKWELVKASEGSKPRMLRPTNSHIGMSLFSVAETFLISLGGMGRRRRAKLCGFLEPPMVFLSLAPFLSFSKKERNGERKRNVPAKNFEKFAENP